jgi:hypothetical protein
MADMMLAAATTGGAAPSSMPLQRVMQFLDAPASLSGAAIHDGPGAEAL